jgi:hypothetical protein
MSNLNDIDIAILRMMSRSNLGTDSTGRYTGIDLIYRNFGVELKEEVSDSLVKLEKIHYIADRIQNPKHKSLALTPLGLSALESQQNIEINTFSNISNSAIANKSSHVTQTVSLEDLPPDITRQIEEFENAIKTKDSSKMKAAFGYIADKSVDAAIALVTGALTR